MTLIIKAQKDLQEQQHQINQGITRIGRSNHADIVLPSEWRVMSSLHFELKLEANGDLSIKDGSAGKKSKNGTQLKNSFVPADNWTSMKPGDEVKIGSTDRDAIRLLVIDTELATPSLIALKNGTWKLNNTELSVGRSLTCDVVVDGPTISRLHCSIKKSGRKYILTDHSTNGVFVNDKNVNRVVELKNGDQIKVGTAIFNWLNESLSRQTQGKNYRIDVRGLKLKGRISDTNISIEPGQLVALVGGSGAGKSSLLTTMVGQNMGYSGSILINGIELRNGYESIKQEIGFVPQDDIVHLDLSVEEVLKYSARLKLPDKEQQNDAVERVLEELDIGHRRKALVKNLSGGQRKRVSIGVELIADPRILFLDEPTSGLDPGLDKRMMQLLRVLADSGRTVALVTHATNNVTLCDQVVFLGRGGYLCYAGPPRNCLKHFGVAGDFSDIYQFLEQDSKAIKKIAETYRPLILKQLPCVDVGDNTTHTPSGLHLPFIGRFSKAFYQFFVILHRDLILGIRDKTSLILNSLTAPLAILMISFASSNREIFVGHQNTTEQIYLDALRILFVIICSTVWVGLSSSLQVLVKERGIFCRERSFNLLPEAYLSSKAVILLIQALVQSILILLTLNLCFDTPQSTFLPWPLAIAFVCFCTLITVGSQALLVSSLVGTSQQAASAAPLLLIPQLIFGGVLFLLKDSTDFIYPLITSRWSMRAAGIYSDVISLIPGAIKLPGSDAYNATIANLNTSFLVLLAQAFVFLLSTLLALLFLKHNR